MLGTIHGQKEELEYQIQLLKGQVENMSLADPSFSIASELGELLVTNLELRNVQDELDQAKQDILVKDILLKEILVAQELLTQQVRPAKDILTESKHVI